MKTTQLLKTLLLSLLILLAMTWILNAANVTLAWDANPEDDIASYTLSYGTAPGVYSESIVVVRGLEQEVLGLQPGTTYYFVVKATNTAGISGPNSDEISYLVPAPPPAPPVKPAGLRVIEIQTSSNLKDWKVDGYYVAREPHPNPQFFRMIATADTPTP